jgi:hypothetical protein
VDWFKMPTDLLMDPVVRHFTAAEFKGWMLALGDAAKYERDGLYSFVGKPPAWVVGLISKGGLVPVDEDGGATRYEVYGWANCMPSVAEISQKRKEARERMERSREHRRTNAFVPTSISTSSSEVVVEGSQKQTVTRRDEAYEALGDWWYEEEGAWKGLPADARGRINDALGQLRNASANEGLDLAAEIRLRGKRARRLSDEWEWTPQTLVRYWRKLANEPKPKLKASTSAALSRARELKEAGR